MGALFWVLLLTLCTVTAVYIGYRCFAYKKGIDFYIVLEIRYLYVYHKAKDRRCREGETEREIEEELETAGVIYDRPVQAAGRKQFAMNDNMAYSTTIAKGRRCRGVTVKESGHIPEEGQLETTEVIYDRPEQAAGGRKQFAMNDNISYSTIDRRCRKGAKERQDRDIPEEGALIYKLIFDAKYY